MCCHGHKMVFMSRIQSTPWSRCCCSPWEVRICETSQTKEDELNNLKHAAEMLNEELKWIEQRIKTLESQA
ncbi:MAG: DUF5320 domain-containing protein [Pseudothermotoga sp.]